MYELFGRQVLTARRERVRELQRGELLRRDRRDLVRRVRGVPGGGVFGDGGREQFDCVCIVSGRDVFKHCGGERVHGLSIPTHIFLTRNCYIRWMWMCRK